MSRRGGNVTEMEYPCWYDGKILDEVLFCEDFLASHPMKSVNDTFSRWIGA